MLPWILTGICFHTVRYIQISVVYFHSVPNIYYLYVSSLYIIFVIVMLGIRKRLNKKSVADTYDKLYENNSNENDYYKLLP
jgi:hypothetical protein